MINIITTPMAEKNMMTWLMGDELGRKRWCLSPIQGSVWRGQGKPRTPQRSKCPSHNSNWTPQHTHQKCEHLKQLSAWTPEDGSSSEVRKIGMRLHGYTVSQPRRTLSRQPPLYESSNLQVYLYLPLHRSSELGCGARENSSVTTGVTAFSTLWLSASLDTRWEEFHNQQGSNSGRR